MSKVLEFLSRNVIACEPARHDTFDRPAIFGITGRKADGRDATTGSHEPSKCQVAA